MFSYRQKISPKTRLHEAHRHPVPSFPLAHDFNPDKEASHLRPENGNNHLTKSTFYFLVKGMKNQNKMERVKTATNIPPKRTAVVGRTIDLPVTTLDNEGFGLAIHETRKIRIAGALPGENRPGRG